MHKNYKLRKKLNRNSAFAKKYTDSLKNNLIHQLIIEFFFFSQAENKKKQSSEGQNTVLKIFVIFTGKHLTRSKPVNFPNIKFCKFFG